MREAESIASDGRAMPWTEGAVPDPDCCARAPAAGPPATPASINLFGYAFNPASAAAVVAGVAERGADRPRVIVTANIDHIVRLSEDAAFRRAYARAAARTLDGMPLVWLARARTGRPVARVTGHDLLPCVLADPPDFAARVFLVASQQAVADAVADRLKAAGLPASAIASAVPPFGFEHDPAYGTALAARIRAHGTGLLVMGVGAPKSEIWVDRQGAALGSPVVLCVGEALTVAAGQVRRAPVLVQRLGLEWAFRFAFAPRRLFHRYFVRSWRFLAIAVRDRP